MQTADEFWAGFVQDPRDLELALLRASDADRSRMNALLSEAVADGRLTLDEYEQRSESVSAARTLNDFPPLVGDLLPQNSLPPLRRPAPSPLTPSASLPGSSGSSDLSDLESEAIAAYEKDRRDAILGFLLPSLMCLGIWTLVMFGGFFWPGFVMLGTGVNLIQTVVRRDDHIAEHRRKLERKQRKRRNEQQRLGTDPEPPAVTDGD